MNSGEDRQRAGWIEELRDLEESPSPGFFDRVLRSVERRRLASDTFNLSWTVVRVMVLEALDVIFMILGRRQQENSGESR